MIQGFKTGDQYTRDEIKAILGEPPGRGGNWDTGYHRHEDTVFLFSTVGVPARTGHDYGDHWLPDGRFEWFGKSGTHDGQPLIKYMVGDTAYVLLFTREGDRDKFTCHGPVRASQVFDEVPVRVWWKVS